MRDPFVYNLRLIPFPRDAVKFSENAILSKQKDAHKKTSEQQSIAITLNWVDQPTTEMDDFTGRNSATLEPLHGFLVLKLLDRSQTGICAIALQRLHDRVEAIARLRELLQGQEDESGIGICQKSSTRFLTM
jgi:hypothetical protein